MTPPPRPQPTLAADILRTALVLLALLGTAELAFRAVVDELSKNSRTLSVHSERAARIAAAPGETMLILGNSVSGDGIVAERIAAAWASADRPILIEHQPADSSATVDWYYQLKNQFIAVGAVPDVVVLPVGNPYPLTRINPQTEDLLYSFLTWQDLPSYLDLAEVRGFDAQAAVVAGKVSSLYAFRGRLQKRILSTLLPGFPSLRGAMLDARAPAAPRVTETWSRAFATLTAAHDIDVIVVAMPTAPLAARLPDSARAVCSAHGWAVVEAGDGFALAPGELPDGLHLEPAAAVRWSDHLAPELLAAYTAGAP